MDLKTINERLTVMEKDIKMGFNMVATNQEKFGKGLYKRLQKNIGLSGSITKRKNNEKKRKIYAGTVAKWILERFLSLFLYFFMQSY